MKHIDASQLEFIKKEYGFLSGLCKQFFDKGDIENLNAERVRLGVFVNTIEKLFECDFYTEIIN